MEEKILNENAIENEDNGEIMVKIENVSKQYRLGMIGGTTLREALQRWWAKVRKKEDPTRKIGAKNYNKGEKFMALNGVSFEVKKGEAIGLIGHNGAGKSTLLKLLTRVTAPTEGKIYLNGRVASMLEVGTGFHGELTGRENVYMNGAILGMTKKEIDAKIEDIIEFSEVREFIDTPVKRYSSGMFVKLAFSVAAHLDAEIMLMDEVLAVGDMAFQNKCINKMKEVANSGRTIIYVSHNMNTIRALCNRCVVLNKGQVEFVGGVEEGIEIYMNRNMLDNEVNMNLDTKAHHAESTYEIKMNRLELLGKDEPKYNDDEKMILRYNLTVSKDIKNILHHLTLMTEEGFAVGTSMSSLMDFTVCDSLNMDFEFDLSLLAPGKYVVNVAFMRLFDTGYVKLVDHIIRLFKFEVVQKSKKTLAIWDKTYWGKIKFPDNFLINEYKA